MKRGLQLGLAGRIALASGQRIGAVSNEVADSPTPEASETETEFDTSFAQQNAVMNKRGAGSNFEDRELKRFKSGGDMDSLLDSALVQTNSMKATVAGEEFEDGAAFVQMRGWKTASAVESFYNRQGPRGAGLGPLGYAVSGARWLGTGAFELARSAAATSAAEELPRYAGESNSNFRNRQAFFRDNPSEATRGWDVDQNGTMTSPSFPFPNSGVKFQISATKQFNSINVGFWQYTLTVSTGGRGGTTTSIEYTKNDWDDKRRFKNSIQQELRKSRSTDAAANDKILETIAGFFKKGNTYYSDSLQHVYQHSNGLLKYLTEQEPAIAQKIAKGLNVPANFARRMAPTRAAEAQAAAAPAGIPNVD